MKDRRSALGAAPILVVLFCLATLGGLSPARAGEVGDLFREGNAFYDQGRYQEAAERYDRILKRGVGNAAVHFNLGNCHFKQDRLAEALLQYEKAARLAPGDSDTRENLALARQRLGLEPEPTRPWLARRLARLAHTLPPQAAEPVAIGAFVGLNCLAALTIVRGRRGSMESAIRRVAVVVLSAVLAWSAGSAGASAWHREAIEEAIVLRGGTEVASAPGEGGATLFTLPEGHKVRVRAADRGWAHVSLESGWHGWVPEESLGRI